MSNSRLEFEKFWLEEMNEDTMSLDRTEFPMTDYSDQAYSCHETNRSWISWQASRQALDGEPVAYKYWWPESPRHVTVCKAKDLPYTHPDLIVVPLYTHPAISEPCRFHDLDNEACEQFSGQVPCEPYPAVSATEVYITPGEEEAWREIEKKSLISRNPAV